MKKKFLIFSFVFLIAPVACSAYSTTTYKNYYMETCTCTDYDTILGFGVYCDDWNCTGSSTQQIVINDFTTSTYATITNPTAFSSVFPTTTYATITSPTIFFTTTTYATITYPTAFNATLTNPIINASSSVSNMDQVDYVVMLLIFMVCVLMFDFLRRVFAGAKL